VPAGQSALVAHVASAQKPSTQIEPGAMQSAAVEQA
jgi:hypothetical protein